MKLFNTIQELISYLEKCPICGSKNIFSLALGPEYLYRHVECYVADNHLYFKTEVAVPYKAVVNYDIDLNTGEINIIEGPSLPSNLYYYFNNNIITFKNFLIEKETVYLQNSNYKYRITLYYESDYILISKTNLDSVNDSPVVKLPLVNFDFTNVNKVLSKIETLLLFS
jgi:hypothetical protein